jgi:hypothetical protein
MVDGISTKRIRTNTIKRTEEVSTPLKLGDLQKLLEGVVPFDTGSPDLNRMAKGAAAQKVKDAFAAAAVELDLRVHHEGGSSYIMGPLVPSGSVIEMEIASNHLSITPEDLAAAVRARSRS